MNAEIRFFGGILVVPDFIMKCCQNNLYNVDDDFREVVGNPYIYTGLETR